MIELRAGVGGTGRRVGIVVSRFNEIVTENLLDGALDCLRQQGVDEDHITVARVPGAWEIPAALMRLGRSGDFDALIALGAVIRGATPHFDYVAAGVSNGVAAAASALDRPIAFGVLTTDTLEQALERAGAKGGNKGWDSALAALEMANLFDQLSG